MGFTLYLDIIGISILHKMSKGRALLALILPLIVGIGGLIIFIGILGFIISIIGAIGG